LNGTIWWSANGLPAPISVPGANSVTVTSTSPTGSPPPAVGDFYLDTTTSAVYQFSTSGWNLVFNSLVGPQGIQGSAGAKWWSGSSAPTAQNPIGQSVGDYYLNTTTGDVYQYSTTGWGNSIENLQGHPGLQGAAGSAGSNGATWLSGQGSPLTTTTGQGAVGDFYLDIDTGNVYLYGDNGWSATTIDLQGQRGATWFSGRGVPTSIPGSALGDFYLDTSAGQVYQFIVGGTWVSSVSLVGPQGLPGLGTPQSPPGAPTAITLKAANDFIASLGGGYYVLNESTPTPYTGSFDPNTSEYSNLNFTSVPPNGTTVVISNGVTSYIITFNGLAV